jgi:hypothetical protein
MRAVGVPAQAARDMLTTMHRYGFAPEHVGRVQQETIRCAKAGLPAEPMMNKAMEGMAKQASEQQILAAMTAVHSRYAQANRLAKTISEEKETVDAVMQAIADSLAAGMQTRDMEAVAAHLEIQTRQQTMERCLQS